MPVVLICLIGRHPAAKEFPSLLFTAGWRCQDDLHSVFLILSKFLLRTSKKISLLIDKLEFLQSWRNSTVYLHPGLEESLSQKQPGDGALIYFRHSATKLPATNCKGGKLDTKACNIIAPVRACSRLVLEMEKCKDEK